MESLALPVGWESEKLDTLCDVEYGTRVVRKKDGGTIYPVYGGGGATFFMDTFNRQDCLVVARFAMSEKCTRFIKGKFFLNDSGLSVKPKDTEIILQEFLNKYFIFLNDYIYSLARGAAQKNLNLPAFRKIEISYPKSLSQQKQIVATLDKAFSAIDTAKANAEQNLQNVKELFESYSKDIFEKKGDDWGTKNLGEVCNFFNGFAFKSKDSVDNSNTQVIRIGNLYQNRLDLDRKPAFYPDDFVSKYSKYLLKENDLIISLTGTVGKEDYGYTVKIPKTDRSLLLNQRIAKITLKSDRVMSKDFIFRFLLSRTFLDELYKTANGTRQANLSTENMKDLPVSYPSIEKQKQMVQKLDALSAETKKLEAIYTQKIADLEELKKSVLQKAFSGQLNTRGQSHE